MAVRVSVDEVKALIDTERDVTSFITTANVVVEALLASSSLSVAVLKQIELYLAAHYLALTEESGGLIRDSIGESATTVADVYKAGFMGTRFGQTALTLDSTGILASQGSTKQRAEFKVY